MTNPRITTIIPKGKEIVTPFESVKNGILIGVDKPEIGEVAYCTKRDEIMYGLAVFADCDKKVLSQSSSIKAGTTGFLLCEKKEYYKKEFDALFMSFYHQLKLTPEGEVIVWEEPVKESSNKEYYEYGKSLGIKINDLQRLMMLSKKSTEPVKEEAQDAHLKEILLNADILLKKAENRIIDLVLCNKINKLRNRIQDYLKNYNHEN